MHAGVFFFFLNFAQTRTPYLMEPAHVVLVTIATAVLCFSAGWCGYAKFADSGRRDMLRLLRTKTRPHSDNQAVYAQNNEPLPPPAPVAIGETEEYEDFERQFLTALSIRSHGQEV